MQVRQKKMNKRRRNLQRALKGSISLFVVLVMVLGIVLPNISDVQAAESDSATSTTYMDALGDEASTEYAGRLWTDKSVYSDTAEFALYNSEETATFQVDAKNAEEFLVAYSALATTKEIKGQSQAPIDVVFIIDISGSMAYSMNDTNGNSSTRIKETIKSLNSAIDTLMNLNPYTRVGVVTFSDTASEFLELGHYAPGTRTSKEWVWVEPSNWWEQGHWEQQTVEVTDYFSLDGNTLYKHVYDVTVASDGTTTTSKTMETGQRTVTGGTNIQMGVYTGMNVLASESSTKATINGAQIQRVPSVVLLSDGAPTYSSDSSSWWSPGNNKNDGPGGSPYVGNGMKALMTGAYMKDAIDRNYGISGTNMAATYYTIGMGIANLSNTDRNEYTGEQDLAYMTLNPNGYWNAGNTMSNAIKSAWTTYTTKSGNSYGTPTLNTNRDETYTFRHPSSYDILPEKSGDNALTSLVDSYYGADSAESIEEVFAQIVTNISISVPEVPTAVDTSMPLDETGVVTYTDPIGEYMEVKDVKAIIYAGTVFTKSTTTNIEGGVRYTFEGTVSSSVYGDQDISHIDVEVLTTTDDAGIKEQTVVVKIPASVIPVRVNTVELKEDENGETYVASHTNNGAYPVRVIYSVGLQSAVTTTITNADGESEVIIDTSKLAADYVAANMNTDGTINFYSNLFTDTKSITLLDGTELSAGDTTVTFEPSASNPFYFLQSETEIYSDKDCTKPVSAAAELDDNTTYYYKKTYYHLLEIEAELVARTGAQLKAAGVEAVNGYWNRIAGTFRVNRILDLVHPKTDNTTNTAETFYAPTYNTNAGTQNTGLVTVYLGNNGVISRVADGNLEISKTVVDNGLNPTVPNDGKGFAFTVTFSQKGTYDYDIKDETGTVISSGKLTEAGEGGVLYLKDGETAVFVSIPNGIKYTVEEKAEKGYATSVTGDKGTIEAGKTKTAAFTNTYSVEPVTFPTEGTINGTKVISGLNTWPDNYKFTFLLTPYNNAPLPTKYSTGEASETVTGPDAGKTVEASFDFGSIVFDAPGTYRYTIVEKEPETFLPGVTYSRALYRLVVVVVDNGDGTLKVESYDIQQLYDDNANMQFYYDSENNIVVNDDKQDAVKFVNTYSAGSITRTPVATKGYTDLSGNNKLVSGMFEFKLTPLGVCDSAGAVIEGTAASVPMPLDEQNNRMTEVVTTNEGTDITFLPITYVDANIPKDQDSITYKYQLEEVLPEGATAENNYTVNGMTYDPTKIVVTVVLSKDVENGVLVATSTYSTGERIAHFANTYNPTPATAALVGEKTLTGRDMQADETFDFTISANAATSLAIRNGEITGGSTSAFVKGGTDGVPVAFSTEKYTFTKPGVYTFYIAETAGSAGGVTYDTHTTVATVTVVDNNGTLEATVSYNNGSASTATDKAVFKNTYTTTFDTSTSVTLSGVKKLSGQTLETNEFYFTVTEYDENGNKIAETNVHNQAGSAIDENGFYTGSISILKDVTYTSAGTYTYLIKEYIPSTQITGMTYDTSVYKLVVTVTDDGAGRLYVSNKVLSQCDNYGAETESWTTLNLSDDIVDVVFENTYVPTPTTRILPTITKTLTGNREAGVGENEFQIELSVKHASSANGIALPGDTDGDGSVILGTAAGGTVHFGAITFTKAGEYTISIKEVIPADANKVPGVTYSEKEILATYRVTDDSYGNLTAVLVETVGGTTIENEYHTTGELTLPVTKTLIGRTGDVWSDSDIYYITIEGADTHTIDAIAAGDIILPTETVGEGENQQTVVETLVMTKETKSGEFNIIFKKAGEYTFTVLEKRDADVDGVIYAAPITVHVNAVDDGKGNITATYQFGSDPTWYPAVTESGTTSKNIEFVNKYEPEKTTLSGHYNLGVNKVFTGRDNNEWLSTDEFTFELTIDSISKLDGTVVGSEEYVNYVDVIAETEKPAIESSQRITINSENVTHAHFQSIAFMKEGKYVFNIQEVMPAGATKENNYTVDGITYDSTVQKLYVEVDAKDGGILIATRKDATFENDIPLETAFTFDNTYKVTEVTLPGATNLKVTKTLDGRNWLSSDEFKFKLEPLGEYTKAAVARYNAQDTVKQGILMPENASGISIKGIDSVKEAAFGNIVFYEAGTFNFRITEITGVDDNISYDTHSLDIVVTVVDNGKGQLEVVEPTTSEGDGTIASDTIVVSYVGSKEFKNTFTPDPITATLTGTKTLIGRALDEGEFTFEIAAVSGTNAADKSVTVPMPAIKTVSNEAGKTPTDGVYSADVKFGPIQYTEVGTYVYEITEVKGNLPGVAYDEGKVTATVSVTQKEDGQLQTSVSYAKAAKDGIAEGTAFAFTNVYKTTPTDGVRIYAEKEVIPTDGNTFVMNAGDFTFEIEASQNNPQPDPVASGRKTNDKDGYILFADEEYTVPGTYVYTVHEINSNRGGIIYDTTKYQITVVVTDEDSQLVADVTVATINADGTTTPTTDNKIAFNNGYDPTETTVVLHGHKTLTGNHKTLDANEFEFQISAVDYVVQDEEGNDVVVTSAKNTPLPADTTAENLETGLFQFGLITYQHSGIFKYAITEVIPEGAAAENGYKLNGVTYDSSTHYIVVTVNDLDENGNSTGELKATISGMLDESGNPLVVFTNDYTPAPVTATVSGTKVLEGRTMNAGEFEFALLDSDGEELDTAYNAADETFTLETELSKADTYNFTIVEKDTKVSGVTNNVNNVIYGVQIVVSDAGHDGQLDVESITYYLDGKVIDNSKVVFNNKYEAASVPVQLSAVKVLEGRTLKADEFAFNIKSVSAKDADGKAIEAPIPAETTVKNAADGSISFGEMEFEVPGTYVYEITEVKGSLDYVTYDETAYTVTITVTDNLKGALEAKVSTGDDTYTTPVFKNVYSEPTPTPTPTPEGTPTPTPTPSSSGGTGINTGDSANIVAFVGIAVVALGAILVLVVYLKRKTTK